MKKFKYDIHTHTKETSRCGKASAAEIVDYYKSLDYTGICITDHFINGNSYSNYEQARQLPWKTRVDMFMEGYTAAKKHGDRVGLDIFFGWEYAYRGSDFLTYGLSPEWVYNNEWITSLYIDEHLKAVREQGGFVIHAHPMRYGGHIKMIRLMPDKIDGVEVLNASMKDSINTLANAYAEHYGFYKTAGSDTHTIDKPRLCAMQCERRLTDIHDLIRAIKNNEMEIFTEQYKLPYEDKG